ncbi:hypothetical protein EAO68_02550 [Streptomyces sp. wa22]|nr:hypothetical protein EAO68_02550 [Streptomyces sp. wa22]
MKISIRSTSAMAACSSGRHGLRETIEAVLIEAAPEFIGGLGVVAIVAAVTWAVRRFTLGKLPD